MPSIRIGFSTDFNLTGEQIGIGTTNPTARLDVAGQIVSEKTVDRGGISTITRYGGFLDESQGLSNTVSIAETTKGNLNSLSGEIKISGEVTVTEDTKLTGGRLDSLTVTGKFDLPHGGSEDREDTPEKGSTRFNQDLGQLEFYTGYEWRTVNSYARPGGGGRGVFGGFGPSPAGSTINYINIHTTSNAYNFGDLRGNETFLHGCASSTRGVFGTGSPSASPVADLDYITIASEGDSIKFGDLTQGSVFAGNMLSSSTRGIIHESTNPTTNVISFIEISTVGNAVDFGDMRQGVRHASQFASPTRGVIVGGYRNPQNANYGEFQSITIASKGDSIEFGSLAAARRGQAGFSNSVRGVHGGGVSNTLTTSIEFLTIATGGDATIFGDLSFERRLEGGGCASQTRGVFAGAYNPAQTNNIEYITISTGGDALDFGDLSFEGNTGGLSDSHGGLGGF